MASVLVHIEAEGAQPTEASLRILGEGRRISTTLGAALHAYVRLPPCSDFKLDALAETLGHAGADKMLVAAFPVAEGPALWSNRGEPLERACQQLRPLLVLFAAGTTGDELAPRLAANLGAAYTPDAEVDFGPSGEIVFVRSAYGASHQRRLAAEELQRTVVATLTPEAYLPARGVEAAELEMLAPSPSRDSILYLGAEEDPGAALDTAELIVLAGAGVRSFETYELIEQLAEALGGELAATRNLCARGLAPPEREVGIGARIVSPRVCVICGASGSSATLGGIASNAEIIAIDRNPDAPVFRAASYGLVGELDAVLPRIIQALQGQLRTAVGT